MSTTFHTDVLAHSCPNLTTRVLHALRGAWRCSRSHLNHGYRLFAGCATRLFATSLVVLAMVACDGRSGTVAAAAAAPCPGSVSLAWSITNASGQPLSCAQAAATSVALRLLSRTGGTPVFTAFPCTSSSGIANVAPGLYDATIELRDASGATRATSPPQTSVAVAVGRTKVLTPVTFAVGSGGGGGNRVAFKLEAENASSNCQPSSSGGAGITGTTIFIARNDGGCAPVRLVRSRGGIEIGTYQVNCSSPEVASCIERDETLSTTGFAPGSYTVRVTGKIGPGNCWLAESLIDVPATGQLETRLVLQRQNTPGC